MEEEHKDEKLTDKEEQKEAAEAVEEAEETGEAKEAEEVEEAEKAEKAEGEETPEEISEKEKEEGTVEEAAETKVEEEVAAPVEEEEAKPERKEKEEEEEIVEERIYTIPLSKAWIMPPKKRAPKAMRIIKGFMVKHMKLEAKKEVEEEEAPKRLIISNEVNERIWSRGIEKPSRNIRIRAAKDKEGNVTVYLAEGD